MEDIRRQDRALYVRELLRGGPLFVTMIGSWSFWFIIHYYSQTWALIIGLLPILVHLITSWNRSVSARFKSKRYEAFWNGIQDRLKRFEEVLAKMKKEQIADLQEMPRTMRSVAQSIYAALRRADMINDEVFKTEMGVLHRPPSWDAGGNDAQATELYRVADRNIAEYKQHFAAVMSGVQRAEAQCAVYMTTVDTLRMKMIGYRLVGKQPDLSSQDFLTAMTEAKLQLQAIDQALEELDFRQMPQMIAAIPPLAPPVIGEEEFRA